MTTAPTSIVPDSEYRGIMALLPASLRPFAQLARFDRPIGWWLLFWPCAWGVLLSGGAATHWHLILWMLVGAIAMRSAGCVYNDIVDRDLDAQVERTRLRPLACGAVSLKAAWMWLIFLSLIGLIVLLQLRIEAQLVAVASLALVAAYPYMKRITWWPQAWLGLVFSWGSLVGWVAVTGDASFAMVALYAGSISWVIGYDTVYALQDREDDALIGVRSSALRLGSNVRGGVFAFYAIALKMWAISLLMVRPQPLVLLALAPVAIHFAIQVFTLKEADGESALATFRSNRMAGFLVAMASLVVGSSA
jgi:4-hydroxybenzoate polyprenyltransferase